nr:uncharacterized protein LOC104092230 isoform X2 [Nicotiana tomentosiformis]
MYTHCHLRVLTSLAVTSLYILSPFFFVLLCFHHSNHLHLFKIAAYMICLKLRQKEAEVEKIRTFIRSATIACRGRHQTALLFLLLICRILLATYLLG